MASFAPFPRGDFFEQVFLSSLFRWNHILLSRDITIQLFEFLDGADIAVCALVCKEWCKVAKLPSFRIKLLESRCDSFMGVWRGERQENSRLRGLITHLTTKPQVERPVIQKSLRDEVRNLNERQHSKKKSLDVSQ